MNTTAWPHDPFFQYPRSALRTTLGAVDMPILYQGATILMALFRVPLERARPLVVDPDLELVAAGSGRALAALAFYEYRETTIGPYREVGTALLVRPRQAPAPRWPLLSQLQPLDRRHAGFHVVDLPVTTDAACVAGRELWGYPKFVTTIDFELKGRRFAGAVHDPAGGPPLLRLAGTTRALLPAPLLDLLLYSRLNGPLLRTLVNTRGGGLGGPGGGLRLDVSASSTHPMAQRLHALGLHGARPFFCMSSERLQLRLNAGAPLPA